MHGSDAGHHLVGRAAFNMGMNFDISLVLEPFKRAAVHS